MKSATDLVIAKKIAPPDTEEYSVIIDGLSRAKAQLYSLKVAKALEEQPAPQSVGSRYKNLLQYLVRGDNRAPQGRALQEALEATEAQVQVLEAMLEDYNAREEAFRDSQVVEAKDPAC